MRGSRGSESTDANRRLAMLWGDEDLVRDPVGSTYPESKQIQTTVADQKEDENSLYRYYCKLLSIRHRYPAIARGEYNAIDGGNRRLGGFLISYEGETLLLLHNTSTEALSLDLSSCAELDGYEFSSVLDSIGTGEATLKGTVLVVAPQSSVIIGE